MAQKYMALNGKYLEDAERLLTAGDYPQASEKLWGAVATAISAVATIRGWRRHRHSDLESVVRRLYQETGDVEYLDLFSTAESLHANFYHDFLAAEDVQHHVQRAKQLMGKLQALLG